MGVAFSSLWTQLFGRTELNLTVLGLDNAGKTTLTYQMTMGEAVATAPTVGSNTETFQYKNLRFMLWDVGGQASLRASWSSYLANTSAVVFVFDSTDTERVGMAREELHRIANDEHAAKAPILVFANKQDVTGCMTPAAISEALSLTSLRLQNWHIQGCSALTGKGYGLVGIESRSAIEVLKADYGASVKRFSGDQPGPAQTNLYTTHTSILM